MGLVIWSKTMKSFIKKFEDITIKDIPLVGGKNASLGEMVQNLTPEGILIPPGFAITADAFTALIEHGQVAKKIELLLSQIDQSNLSELSRIGHEIRSLVRDIELPEDLALQIKNAYAELSKKVGVAEASVAVRSSATAEDLPEASFAGLQETFLNVRGVNDLLVACRNCFASLYTDRAISYRAAKGFAKKNIRLSIGVQQMVRSDIGSAGVIFTLDTESGARNVILINSAFGLGENVVGGKVDPDEFLVQKDLVGVAALPIIRKKLGSKQMRLVYSGHGTKTTKNIDVSEADRERLSIDDKDVMQLASWSIKIENYYSLLNKRSTPMDIEWAKDGSTGKLYILQARPETVHSSVKQMQNEIYTLEKGTNKKLEILLSGRAVGAKIGAGKARVIKDASELSLFKDGEVLVADMTDPDWEPIMKKASAIVTNRGGRTCHAAIVSREHGIPCLIGTGHATILLYNGQEITVSCAEGDEGHVYKGIIPYHKDSLDWKNLPKTKTKMMVNLGNPEQALKTSLLPVSGVGLTRIEFIISQSVKIHPMALVNFDRIVDEQERKSILQVLGSYRNNPPQFFIDKLAEGIANIAGAFYPRPVIVRFSDFKTNEYANLLGGIQFEPLEENPMIGFRGASRYYSEKYRDGFALECMAIKQVREVMGLTNVKVMIPFCRSPKEGQTVLKEMAKNGLVRKENNLEVYVMSEIPTNVLRADEFAKIFDGFSIGSNDLTQMILGIDRDSSLISEIFDERDPAVYKMLSMAIHEAKAARRPIGICGQAPSDYPEVARFLVQQGIDSISVTSDVVFKTIKIISEAEGLIENYITTHEGAEEVRLH